MSILVDNRTEHAAAQYVRHVGRVFSVFDQTTQDSGNVSYGIAVGERRLFVKTAGDPGDATTFLGHPERVHLLRNATELARRCMHPTRPTLRNVVESPEGPILAYDWVSGESLGGSESRRADPSSGHQQFRRLSIRRVQDALASVVELHRDLADRGWVAVDFYDSCLLYDFARHRMSVVDLDHYHRGAFRNRMGRMFGSPRFMAPEEYRRGDLIDQRTTVFTLGRTLAVFLGDGTLDRSSFRGGDPLYDVMRRACQSRPEDRFPSVAMLLEAWTGALATGRAAARGRERS